MAGDYDKKFQRYAKDNNIISLYAVINLAYMTKKTALDVSYY